MLSHSGAKVILLEDAAQAAKIAKVRGALPELEHVIVLNDDAAEGAITLADLRARGAADGDDDRARAHRRRRPRRRGDDRLHVRHDRPAEGLRALAREPALHRRRLHRPARSWASAADHLPVPAARARAGADGLVRRDRHRRHARVLERRHEEPRRRTSRRPRPTHVPTVPRLLEKVHTRVVGTGGGGRRREGDDLHARARERARRWPRPSARAAASRGSTALRTPWRPARADEGPRRVRAQRPGPDHRRGADRRRGDRVLRRLRRHRARGLRDDRDVRRGDAQHRSTELRVGSVGRPLPGTEVSIAEDGEILMRGPHVFAGYHRNQEATDEILEGGWLHSGDLGEVDDGYVHITGRKKDLIITSTGKNISPELIESALRETPWISQAVVVGDRRPYLVALVTIDPDEAPRLAEQAGVDRPTRSRWPTTSRSARRLAGHRGRQPAVRADRADQALRDPPARPLAGGGRADADAEGQARRRLQEVRPAGRGSLRRRLALLSAGADGDDDGFSRRHGSPARCESESTRPFLTFAERLLLVFLAALQPASLERLARGLHRRSLLDARHDAPAARPRAAASVWQDRRRRTGHVDRRGGRSGLRRRWRRRRRLDPVPSATAALNDPSAPRVTGWPFTVSFATPTLSVARPGP